MSIFSKTPNDVPAIPGKSLAEIYAFVEISAIFGLRDMIEYQILFVILPTLQTFLWQSFGIHATNTNNNRLFPLAIAFIFGACIRCIF